MKKIVMKKAVLPMRILSPLIIAGITLATRIYAVNPPTSNSALQIPNPLQTDSIPQLIAGIFSSIVKFVAPPLAGVMIIIGSFQMLTAGGNPEKFEKGKKTLFYTFIGLTVVILGALITRLIAEILGVPADVLQEFQNLGP
jgi:hypothetical protein